MVEASGRAFAATWRNEQGEVVGTTYGGTMCLWPVKPWRIKFSGDGFEGVIRCRECPGCLELDRRRMADRLVRKYQCGCARGATRKTTPTTSRAGTAENKNPQMFVVRIWAPIELHASIAHKLHRRRGLELEPGMWRLGAGSFAVLARVKLPLHAVLTRLGIRHRIEPLRLSRGRRAWRLLTAGLTVAREIYGEQRNRWYARGLPPAERQKWEVQKIGQYKSYDRARSPRAWTGRQLVLVPPEVWQLRRVDRRALRGKLLRQSDPEGVARVMRLVSDAISSARTNFNVTGAPKALLTREQVVSWYERMASAKSKPGTALPDAPDHTPSSERGGYVSSEHNQGELMPQELARARRKEWGEARKRKAINDSMEIIERMRKKSRGGPADV
jgi:hypothetical protein